VGQSAASAVGGRRSLDAQVPRVRSRLPRCPLGRMPPPSEFGSSLALFGGRSPTRMRRVSRQVRRGCESGWDYAAAQAV